MFHLTSRIPLKAALTSMSKIHLKNTLVHKNAHFKSFILLFIRTKYLKYFASLETSYWTREENMTAKIRIQCAAHQCIEIFGSTKECVRTPVTRTGIHGIPGRLGYHPICIANIVSYRSLPSYINKPYISFTLSQSQCSYNYKFEIGWLEGRKPRKVLGFEWLPRT